MRWRLELLLPHHPTWAQAMALRILPPNLPSAIAAHAATLDELIYGAGDMSVDVTWYAKRIAVSAIFKSTELFLLTDASEDKADTWQFLARRFAEADALSRTAKQVGGERGWRGAPARVLAGARNEGGGGLSSLRLIAQLEEACGLLGAMVAKGFDGFSQRRGGGGTMV
jgi:hypothetical protein